MSQQDPWSGSAPIAPDIAWIEPGFAIGSRPFPAQCASIRELGVDAVIAVHAPGENDAVNWSNVGVEHLAFPTNDWIGIPPRQFDQVVEAVAGQRAAGRAVLLHCLAGINRAPTFATAVLCKRDGLSVDEALRRVRAARPGAAPTPEQLASLRTWLRRGTQVAF